MNFTGSRFKQLLALNSTTCHPPAFILMTARMHFAGSRRGGCAMAARRQQRQQPQAWDWAWAAPRRCSGQWQRPGRAAVRRRRRQHAGLELVAVVQDGVRGRCLDDGRRGTTSSPLSSPLAYPASRASRPQSSVSPDARCHDHVQLRHNLLPMHASCMSSSHGRQSSCHPRDYDGCFCIRRCSPANPVQAVATARDRCHSAGKRGPAARQPHARAPVRREPGLGAGAPQLHCLLQPQQRGALELHQVRDPDVSCNFSNSADPVLTSATYAAESAAGVSSLNDCHVEQQPSAVVCPN